MSWSSGKDSALALHRARAVDGLDVSRLLVSINADAHRVSMHAVRDELFLGSETTRFAWGVDALLTGITASNDPGAV